MDGEITYVVTWEVEWRNLGIDTLCEDDADDLADARSIVDRLLETRLALEAADPKGEQVSVPSIENIRIVYRHTREMEITK